MAIPRLIRHLPHYLELGGSRKGRRVFLRREYDRLGGYVGAIAREYRKHLANRVGFVAVVGSLGKSTTTRAIRAGLATPDRSFSAHNYGTSLAQNVLRVRPWDEWAVFEAGIAGPGKMGYYGRLLRPDIVVVTSIRSDHNRSFPTLLHTREEKVKMVEALTSDGLALLNGDDEHVRWMATRTSARVLTFGVAPDNDLRATDLRSDASGRLLFNLQLRGTKHTVRSGLIGEHMVYPLLAALAVCDAAGTDLLLAIERLSRLEPTPSRMQLLDSPEGIRIVDDTFKGSIESIRAALAGFARIEGLRKVVVMGDIEEAPKPEGDAYREIGERIAEVADVLVCIGGDRLTTLRAAACRAGLPRDATYMPGKHVSGAIPLLRELLCPGDVVLVKGTSAQRLQRLVLGLQGEEVKCTVRYCGVKARCDYCPLLAAPPERFRNPLVSRYIKEPGI